MARDDATEHPRPDAPKSPPGEAPNEAIAAAPPQPKLQDAPAAYAYYQQIDAGTYQQQIDAGAPPPIVKPASAIGMDASPPTQAFVLGNIEVGPDGWHIVGIGGLLNLATGLVHAHQEGRALPSVVCIDARDVRDADVLLRRLQEFEAPLGDAATAMPAIAGTVAGIDAPREEFDEPPAWLAAYAHATTRPADFVPPRRVVLLDPGVYDRAKALAAEQFGPAVALIPAIASIAARDAYEEFKRRALASFSDRAAARRADAAPLPPGARNILTPEQKAAFDEWVRLHRDDD